MKVHTQTHTQINKYGVRGVKFAPSPNPNQSRKTKLLYSNKKDRQTNNNKKRVTTLLIVNIFKIEKNPKRIIPIFFLKKNNYQVI